MKLLEKLKNSYNLTPFKDGILYIERDNKNENSYGKLFYDSGIKKSLLDQFDAAFVSKSFYLCCSNSFQNEKDARMILLNDDFDIIKKLPDGVTTYLCNRDYYYAHKDADKGLFSYESDDLWVRKNNVSGYGKMALDNNYYVEADNETGILYINNISDKTCLTIDVFKSLKIPLSDDSYFSLAYLIANNLLVFTHTYFVIIDCKTGEILFQLDTQIGFRQFEVVFPTIYCSAGSHIAKYMFETHNSIKDIYKHRLERAENEYVGNDYISLSFIRRINIFGNKIYGINTSTPSFLLVQDASNGQRLEAIDLRQFGIKEASEVVVTKDKFYISDYDSNVWILKND